jgi:hypothetical protein
LCRPPASDALREARFPPALALAAAIAPVFTLEALAVLGLSNKPFYDPFRARGGPGHVGFHGDVTLPTTASGRSEPN